MPSFAFPGHVVTMSSLELGASQVKAAEAKGEKGAQSK